MTSNEEPDRPDGSETGAGSGPAAGAEASAGAGTDSGAGAGTDSGAEAGQGGVTPGGSPAGDQRRTRLFGMVAAGAAMVVLAIVAWVVVDGLTTQSDGESSASSGRAGSEDRTADRGDGRAESGPGESGGGTSRDGSGEQEGQRDGQEPPQAENGQSKELSEHLLSLQRREPDDPLAKGAVDAPVVVIMYEDFRCPYCAKFATDVEPALEPYVEKGQVRLEWRDYPIFGDQSLAMAKAARAASKQDKFWEFYEVAFSFGDGNGKPRFPDERIRQVAEQAGVPDMDKFDRDRKSSGVMDEIATDATEGQQIGVSSTPSFLINDQPVLGAQPVDVFVSIIEDELENS